MDSELYLEITGEHARTMAKLQREQNILVENIQAANPESPQVAGMLAEFDDIQSKIENVETVFAALLESLQTLPPKKHVAAAAPAAHVAAPAQFAAAAAAPRPRMYQTPAAVVKVPNYDNSFAEIKKRMPKTADEDIWYALRFKGGDGMLAFRYLLDGR